VVPWWTAVVVEEVVPGWTAVVVEDVMREDSTLAEDAWCWL
jgi:hypothetical protein